VPLTELRGRSRRAVTQRRESGLGGDQSLRPRRAGHGAPESLTLAPLCSSYLKRRPLRRAARLRGARGDAFQRRPQILVAVDVERSLTLTNEIRMALWNTLGERELASSRGPPRRVL
jgi:hypothetical protein